MNYHAMIIGGGVAGMESALILGDMGFKVLLVEKEASIGGKMILLSKVFPTLDCASCISTPKMAATVNHPNIETMIYSEVDSISRNTAGQFDVRLTRKAAFIDPAKCTGCSECEPVCTVAIPDEFNSDLIARRAAHIAFPQAVPKKAIITAPGISPCTFTCPAGVKPHGYISLVRAGKDEEAFRQHLEDAPLPGCLSRACYAPCEGECSRDELEGNVAIRGIKRFMVDRYYGDHPMPEYGAPEEKINKRVAVIGSGPAGLAAAFWLGRKGYSVTVFEGSSEPGGIMRWGIPSYRLPKDILTRDVKNITALGVEIKTNTRVESLASLKKEGFDAGILAVGLTGGRKLSIPGEESPFVQEALAFLKQCNGKKRPNLTGKTVAVIGGGNVAVDCARSAARLGAAAVTLVCLECRGEMPAHDWEIQQAEEEGVRIIPSWSPRSIEGDGKSPAQLQFVRCTSVFDPEGRFNPVCDESEKKEIEADFVIRAIGLIPDTNPFGKDIALNVNGTITVTQKTLQTSLPNIFACGDAVTGPTSITETIGHAKKAAFYLDRYLRGEYLDEVDFDSRFDMVDKENVVSRYRGSVTEKKAALLKYESPETRKKSFKDFEQGFSEEEARMEANRCLDCGGCSQCRECVNTCPADAISFEMRPEKKQLSVGTVLLATGFEVFDAAKKPELGYGRFPNVIDAMQMDRILSPTRPYNAVLRPSDAKTPSNIAFVLCTGSRDCSVDNRLCSRVCCMYSLKQAQLLLGALPLADITIYYIDIRSFGKGYEEFYEQAKGMGVYFTKGKVARIEETAEADLEVYYEDIEGNEGIKKANYDLVVLSVGLLPTNGVSKLFAQDILELDPFNFIKETDEDIEPAKTSIEGVFVAGAASAIRDIPDSIFHSGAAAAQAAAYLKKTGNAS